MRSFVPGGHSVLVLTSVLADCDGNDGCDRHEFVLSFQSATSTIAGSCWATLVSIQPVEGAPAAEACAELVLFMIFERSSGTLNPKNPKGQILNSQKHKLSSKPSTLNTLP